MDNIICNLCGCNNEITFDIFQTSFQQYNPISIIFQQIFDIQMIPGDDYPNIVCKPCLDEAVEALEFKNTWDNSNAALGKYFQTVNKTEPIEQLVEIKRDDFEETVDFENDKNLPPFPQSVSGLYDCKICQKPFFSFKNLQHHTVIHTHSTKCRICKEDCENVVKLKKHYEKHSRNKITLCSWCGGSVINNFHNSDFNFICPICNFVYPCNLFLKNHITFDHPNEEIRNEDIKILRNDKKDTFDFDMENLIDNNLHDELIDVNIIEYKCSECNKIFNSMRKLENHLSQLKCCFICDICNVRYKLKIQLKMHMMDKHLGVRPHTCNICKKDFVRKGMLLSHLKVHSKERCFQCHECGKKFVSAATLRYHSRLHTGEKPYICSICGEGFVKSSRLREHEQKWHIGKLQCPKCMTTFSQRCSLKTHMDRFHPNTYNKNHNYLANQNQQVAMESQQIEENDKIVEMHIEKSQEYEDDQQLVEIHHIVEDDQIVQNQQIEIIQTKNHPGFEEHNFNQINSTYTVRLLHI